MLNVTDAAREHLSELLSQQDANGEAAIRLMHTDEGIKMRIDQPVDSDTGFELNGKTVLVVGDESLGPLAGKTLDVRADDDGQPALVID